MKPGWLLKGLKEASRIGRDRPELVKRVRDNPSGFFSDGPRQSEEERLQQEERQFTQTLHDENRDLTNRLAAISRIVRRVLASGQLEKLEDAKPYLDEGRPNPARNEASGETTKNT